VSELIVLVAASTAVTWTLNRTRIPEAYYSSAHANLVPPSHSGRIRMMHTTHTRRTKSLRVRGFGRRGGRGKDGRYLVPLGRGSFPPTTPVAGDGDRGGFLDEGF
jgi:hypothetical protein